MKRIDVDPTTCIASGLSQRPWENQCHTIEMADQPIARGGQGEISAAVHIDGHHTANVLVKTFHQGFPPSLLEIIARIRHHNTHYGIEQCTALRALPLFLFTGTLQGQPVQGYVMRRVTGKPLSAIHDDENDLNVYINLPWADRIALCRQFVEGMDILYSLRIVHADLNGQNLMIDMAQAALTIIDLDGGTVAGTGLTPGTIGKLEPGWLAPEIMAKLAQTTARQQIPIGIAVDLWSTACGVHHLLFGLSPFFFMAQQAQIADYLARYTWPQLHGLQSIATHNTHVFDYYERASQQAPARRLMEFAFQRGYLDPAQRPTAYQWLQEFAAAMAQAGRAPHPRPGPPRPFRLAPCWLPVQCVLALMLWTRCTASTVARNCAVIVGVRTVRASVSSCRWRCWHALDGIGRRRRRAIVPSVEAIVSPMDRYERLVLRILQGTSDANIAFNDLCQFLRRLGFEERIRGGHHIFRKHGIEEKINLQRDNHNAKVYQVRQVRAMIFKYNLRGAL